MNTQLIYGKKDVLLWVLSAAVLTVLVGLLVAGCTDTLQGDRNANQRPIVRFANIPPEGQQFSRNPIVYWYGSDVDGLVDHYRYHVRPASEMGAMTPEDYIMTVNEDDWVYIPVDPASADPQTTQSLPLVADTSNPVRGFVAQWVFLQAFDLEGLGSEIVYRMFSRNDNPPATTILDFSTSLPFVNAPQPGGIVTGVRLTWQGQDRIDYPTDPPPFEFQWRLYGPYTADTMALIQTNFVKTVFQSNDGFIYKSGEIFEVCDTTYTDTGNFATCDTFVVGSDQIPTYLGTLLTNGYLDIDAPAFQSNPNFNVLADSSCLRDPECLASLPTGASDTLCPCLGEWVTGTSDTLYNVYKNYDTDSTIERNFIFWIRSRDDAQVPDPTPDFDPLSVIEPRFERDVFVMDWSVVATTLPPGIRIGRLGTNPYDTTSPIFQWWRARLQDWAVASLGDSIPFALTTDYGFKRNPYPDNIPLRTLLQHKVLILYNDGPGAPPIYVDSWMKNIFKAIDAGVNVWATMRGGFASGGEGGVESPDVGALHNTRMGQLFSYYFGVSRGLYSAWFNHAASLRGIDNKVPADVQDCMGFYSLNTAQWPDLTYDTARIHSLYNWAYIGGGQIYQFFNPELPYLGEINWAAARYGAEVMYLYKSHYGSRGDAHPMGVTVNGGSLFDYNFEGAPTGHRYNAGLFKTVYMSFTPYALEQNEGLDALFRDILDYLYDPAINAGVSDNRYDDAAIRLSVSDQRARYWKGCDLETLEQGGELSREAWENLRR